MRSQQVEPLDVGSPVEVESALVKDGPDRLERRLLEASPQIGLVDGTSGRLEPTADGLPLSTHMGLVELLQTTAQRAIRTGGAMPHKLD